MNKGVFLLLGLAALVSISMFADAGKGPRKSDLMVSNMSFSEYWVSTNSTSVLYVDVFVTVKNQGQASAGASYTRTVGLNTAYAPTPSLAPGATYVFVRTYACSSAHAFTATADYFNAVSESNEANNAASTYVDCAI